MNEKQAKTDKNAVKLTDLLKGESKILGLFVEADGSMKQL